MGRYINLLATTNKNFLLKMKLNRTNYEQQSTSTPTPENDYLKYEN